MGGHPVVGVVMGSDSDWPVMQAAAAALEEFGVGYEADVVSAHRMPHEMMRGRLRAPARHARLRHSVARDRRSGAAGTP